MKAGDRLSFRLPRKPFKTIETSAVGVTDTHVQVYWPFTLRCSVTFDRFTGHCLNPSAGFVYRLAQKHRTKPAVPALEVPAPEIGTTVRVFNTDTNSTSYFAVQKHDREYVQIRVFGSLHVLSRVSGRCLTGARHLRLEMQHRIDRS